MAETLQPVAREERTETRPSVDVHLVDRLLFSGSLNELSSAIIQVIHNTLEADQPVYDPDAVTAIADTLAENGDNANVEAHIERVLTAFERLHEAVRARLENPQTDIERDLVTNYKEQVSPWTHPYKRPATQVIIHELGNRLPESIRKKIEAQENFSTGTPAEEVDSPYLVELKKKKPSEVLADIEASFVGLDELKRDAQKLSFTQAFEAALAKNGAADTEEKVYGEVVMGNEGLGKSSFVRKKAELLVSLGLAGPVYIEFTQENSAGPSVNMPPQAMAALFSQADIISLEVPEPVFDARPDVPDFGRRMIAALQASLEGREHKPAVFLTGKPETIEDILSRNPGLKPYIGSYYKVEDMSAEQLGTVLDKTLAKKGLRIDDDARAEVIKAFEESRKKIGKEFANAVEAIDVAKNLPQAMATRLYGPDATVPSADGYDDKTLTTVTLADVKSLNLRRILAGPALARRNSIGF